MAVLADVLTGLTTALQASPASFTVYTQSREPHDKAGTVHQKFKLWAPGTLDRGPSHGGGVHDLTERLRLELWHDPEGRESTIWSTVADDRWNAKKVILKRDNWPSGCRLIDFLGESTEEQDTRRIHTTMDFTVQIRETFDLS